MARLHHGARATSRYWISAGVSVRFLIVKATPGWENVSSFNNSILLKQGKNAYKANADIAKRHE